MTEPIIPANLAGIRDRHHDIFDGDITKESHRRIDTRRVFAMTTDAHDTDPFHAILVVDSLSSPFWMRMSLRRPMHRAEQGVQRE